MTVPAIAHADAASHPNDALIRHMRSVLTSIHGMTSHLTGSCTGDAGEDGEDGGEGGEDSDDGDGIRW